MENKIMMPAYCTMLTEEEMTYTEGGATMTQALLAWLTPYGWYKGITAARDYRRANPNTWFDTGLDALTADMEKSVANAVYDIACTAWVVSVTSTGVGAVINAVILFS